MSQNVAVPDGEFVSVQGYDIRQSSGATQTVVVDDQGAVHLPPAVPDEWGQDSEQWFVRPIDPVAPMTRDPDPVDGLGLFVLTDGKWAPA